MKNIQFLSISLIIVSVAFVFISFLVVLTRGKNKYLISKKLRIGAIIISMTCLANGCKPFVTCYEPAMDPVLNCTDSVNSDGVIVVNKDDSEIDFTCMYMYYEYVSYVISKDSQTLFSGDCIKTSTDTSQNLKVPFPRQMDTGIYKLQLYYLKASALVEESSPFTVFDIKVID